MAKKTKKEDLTPEQAEIEEIKDDLDVKAELELVAQSKGGKILMQGFLADAISAIETLSVRYKSLTMQEFVGLCADLKVNLDSFRALKRAPKLKKELYEILKEKLGE